MSIVFSNHFEGYKFNYSAQIKELILLLLKKEKKKLGEISIVFTSNKEILEINKSYLKHNYFTDVIAFSNSRKCIISGDILISVEQVQINSKKYKSQFIDEITRVIIHGILHLIGYNDSSDSEKEEMRIKEDFYLWTLELDKSLEKGELNL